MSARRAASSFKTRAPSELKRPIRTRPPRFDEGPASHSSSPTSNARAATVTPTPPRILRPTDVRVIYTDKALTVIAKPSGLMSQPDVSNPNGLDLALKAVRQKLSLPRDARFFPVHRLDRQTTGAMLLPTSQALARDLSQQFAAHTIEKTYLALVRGGAQSFTQKEGVLEERLMLEDGRVRKARKGEEGTMTKTRWELVASSPKVPLSLLRLHPETGHKHQLRIHCSRLEAPVLGDDLHAKSRLPPNIASLSTLSKDHMYLHASSISIWRFVKLREQESARRVRLTLTAPLPEEWRRLCREIGVPLAAGELRGGITVDGHEQGEEEADGVLNGLYARWLG